MIRLRRGCPLNRNLVARFLASNLRYGSNWRDLRDPSRVGVLTNAAEWSNVTFGNGGGSIFFHGTGGTVDIDNGELPNAIGCKNSSWSAVTVLAGDGGNGAEFSIWNFFSGSDSSWIAIKDGGSSQGFYYKMGGAHSPHYYSFSPVAFQFYHVVQTWDLSNIRLYVDGRHVKTQAQTITGSNDYTSTTMGEYPGVWDWGGYVSEWSVYSGVLSESEVNLLYRDAKSGYSKTTTGWRPSDPTRRGGLAL